MVKTNAATQRAQQDRGPWRCKVEVLILGRGMLCCSTRYKAEETIKITVTSDLGKS